MNIDHQGSRIEKEARPKKGSIHNGSSPVDEQGYPWRHPRFSYSWISGGVPFLV
jgi:hypothetical protein